MADYREDQDEDCMPPPCKRSRVDHQNGLENGSYHMSIQINDLPFEVLEQIFVHLPIHSLVYCRLVCKLWDNIISSTSFTVWKKRYFQFKYNHKKDVTDLPIYDKRSDFITFLIQTVTDKFKTFSPPANPDEILQRLPHYSNVSKSVKNCPELLNEGEESLFFPATISLMVLFSDSVNDILMILNTLVSVCPSVVAVLELFYFLCLVFYKMWMEEKLPQKHHYMVYHAVVVFERSPSVSPSLSAGDHQLPLTSEQLKIVHHKLVPGETIKIVAFAGTGKTTTLVEFTKTHPSLTFLYTVYNRSMKESADMIFCSSNVECRTFHSIAYQAIRSKFKFSYSKLMHVSLEPYHLGKYLIDEEDRERNRYLKKWLHATLQNFFASDDDELSMELHVPHLSELRRTENENYIVDPNERKQVFKLAKQVWADMIDRDNTDMQLSHDGYLKFYQLNNPVISGYDCLLVDEAQDITPAIKSIIDNQSNASKMFVGDPHQQIYSFRGASNALYRVTPDHSFYLTQSFRFGPRIAYLASCVLDVLKEVREHTITGSMKQDGYYGNPVGQVAFITRTNSMVFDTVVDLSQSYPHACIGLTTDIKTFKKDLNTILDVYQLYKNEDLDSIKNKLIKTMLGDERPFESLKAYAQRNKEESFLRKIQLVERHKDAIPTIVSRIESCVTSNWRIADYVITTAHKSKGLEFETVVVCNDFIPNYFNEIIHPDFDVPVDEKNLVYVAITRATKQVFINPTILKLLGRVREYFLYHGQTENTENTQGTLILCVLCGNEGPSSTIHRHGVSTSFPNLPFTQAPLSEGRVCLSCAHRHLPHLKQILK